MLTRPSKGTRKQKNGSCSPSNRSFRAKSTAGSVAFAPQWKKPVEACFGDLELDLAKERANKNIASINNGRDERRQRSMPSAKVIKTPIIKSVCTRIISNSSTNLSHHTR